MSLITNLPFETNLFSEPVKQVNVTPIFKKDDQTLTAQKTKFSIKDFFSKCDQILNGKLHFMCSDCGKATDPFHSCWT